MSVVLSVEDLGACRKQVRIEIPQPAVEAETERVVRELRKRARIKGFRKGKVPLDLVRSRYPDDIRQQVLERLVPRYWRQAQGEAELEPLLPPEIGEVEYEPGSPLTFSATVETRPRIELGDIESFDLPEHAVEPTAEEIDRAVEDIRRGVARWVDAGRPAARGDRATGTLTEIGPEAKTERVAFEVGDPQIWEELSLAVTGATAGSEVEFGRREPAGQAADARRYKLAVESVEERELPPLDDDFAARVGEFESLEALRTAVSGRLRQQKARERHQKRETALLDQLCERHPLEVPEGVVGHEIESMLREYAGELERRGVDLEQAGFDWQRMAEEARPGARKRVHSRLLLDAIAEHLGVGVSESEFESQLGLIARAEGKPVPAVRRALDQAGRLEDLRRRLVRAKTMDRLLGEDAGVAETEQESAGRDDG